MAAFSCLRIVRRWCAEMAARHLQRLKFWWYYERRDMLLVVWSSGRRVGATASIVVAVLSLRVVLI